MPYYSYYKAQTVNSSQSSGKKNQFFKRLLRLLPNIFIVVGATAVTTVLYPMFSYQLTNQRWEGEKIISPIPQEEWDVARGVAQHPQQINIQNPQPAIAYQETDSKPKVVADIDYTKAENWFSGKVSTKKSGFLPAATTYTISVPKLDINDMVVEIGGSDLDKHLIHYAGTALPGEFGNPVIFGHSVLPLFYNPKSYLAVFSKLPTLEKGDEIFVKYDGIEYKYVVDSYHEVEPDQVEVLEQRYDRQTMTLITCVPPGTYLRRGVILATLEKY
ncbi:MAG: sortase [Patescibacteria group bacterium]|jgi:LPXTG-site transpeptidase (sortase) family protein